MTSIEWTDITWNPTTGCDRVSRGCDRCYALGMAKRLKAMGAEKYQTDGDPRTSGPGFGIAVHEDVLPAPFGWRKPHRVFVNSMSDLFHDGVPDEFIAKVFVVMALAERHTFQILTKRHGRMRSLLSSGERWRNLLREADTWACFLNIRDIRVPVERFLAVREWIHGSGDSADPVAPLPNVWLGVSAEDQQCADRRIPALLRTPAAVRFVSAEPLVGPLDLSSYLIPNASACWTPGHVPDRADKRALSVITRAAARRLGERYLDWVIVGGESGPGARPMHPAWARSLRDQCDLAAVPFHFKQRGEWTWDQRGEDDTEPDVYVNQATGETADEDTALADGGSWTGVWRVGKKRAGRDLDRLTHDEFPERAA